MTPRLHGIPGVQPLTIATHRAPRPRFDGAAPPGWGFHPSAPMGDIESRHLPELPVLSLVSNRQRNATIVRALAPLPFLYRTKAAAVASRYELSYATAWETLDKARKAS